MTITFTTTGAQFYDPYSAGYAAGYRTASTVAGACLGGMRAYDKGIRANDDPNRLIVRTIVGAATWGVIFNMALGAAINISHHI